MTNLATTNAPLTFAQLEQLWTQAGGDPAWAPTMAGIAMEESSGNPTAWNNDPSTGDNSVGLWQINYYGNLLGPRTQEYGPPQSMTQPLRNAQAAVHILGHNGSGLHAWTNDAVTQAAMAAGRPLTAAQVNAILGGQPPGQVVGTGTAAGPAAALAAGAAPAGQSGFALGLPPGQPKSAGGAFGWAQDLANSISYGAEFAGWSVLAGLVLAVGLMLLAMSLALFAAVLIPGLGTAAGVAASPMRRARALGGAATTTVRQVRYDRTERQLAQASAANRHAGRRAWSDRQAHADRATGYRRVMGRDAQPGDRPF